MGFKAVRAVEGEWALIKSDLESNLKGDMESLQQDYTSAIKDDYSERCNARVRDLRDEWHRQQRKIEEVRINQLLLQLPCVGACIPSCHAAPAVL